MAEDMFVAVPNPTAPGPKYVTVEHRPDAVALVRIDRPKANALSTDLLFELKEVAQQLTMNPPGAVVVWGGEHIFAAGADISEIGSSAATKVAAAIGAALHAVTTIPRVSIAAINGYALGGGLELALACDLRVCAADSKLGLPEILLGVIPGGGGTQRLPRLIGEARAKELILTGREVGAVEALSFGMVNRVVPATDVLDTALAMAAEFARGALVAQAMAKDAIEKGLETTLKQGLQIELSHFLAAARTDDARIGIKSFRENGPGKATFTGK